MLNNNEVVMLRLIEDKPDLTIKEIKREWRRYSGRAGASNVINILEARGLILIERDLDTILISASGASLLLGDV
tara:strand:- start:379 stop:600 length:222 start_codon:yes stop_codon:yes gene_type:complete